MATTNVHSNPSIASRQVVLVDLENLCGGSDNVRLSAERVQAELLEALPAHDCRQVVVAYGEHVRRTCPDLPFAWSGARVLFGRGVDGADQRLLEVLAEPARSSHVVLCSGDGIFTDAIARLQEAGSEVTVLARPGSIARRLQLAVQRVLTLSEPAATPATAA
jgi:hypothetical protein